MKPAGNGRLHFLSAPHSAGPKLRQSCNVPASRCGRPEPANICARGQPRLVILRLTRVELTRLGKRNTIPGSDRSRGAAGEFRQVVVVRCAFPFVPPHAFFAGERALEPGKGLHTVAGLPGLRRELRSRRPHGMRAEIRERRLGVAVQPRFDFRSLGGISIPGFCAQLPGVPRVWGSTFWQIRTTSHRVVPAARPTFRSGTR